MRERRHLEARALSAIDHVNEALALLSQDETREAALLRADINWRAELWADAATEFSTAFEGAEGVLSTDEQHLVMRQVVALMLSGDTLGLANVRQRFSEFMAANVYRDSFNLITKSTDNGDVPVHELPRILANIEGVEAFLRTYRESPSDNKASAVN
jgi:hypothetical protein